MSPIRIRIERGQRGNVGWEISVHGENADQILAQIREIDRKLAAEYPRPVDIKEPAKAGSEPEY
jgi:hypothetical protein